MRDVVGDPEVVLLIEQKRERSDLSAASVSSAFTLAHPNGGISNSESIGRSLEAGPMSTTRFCLYGCGILVSYGVFGIHQEAILRSRYGEAQEHFRFQFSLMFIQLVVNYLLARTLLATVWKQGRDTTHHSYYVVSSFFYVGAMLTSFSALKFVNYPTQVVAKSCKPIPIMLINILFARKRYTLSKFFRVILIVFGVFLFMFKGDRSYATSDNSFFGNLLLVASLAGDGCIAAVQERMRQNFQTKSIHMMSNMNFYSLVYVGAGLLVTGEVSEFMSFVHTYPQLYTQIALFSICSAVGQIFIYSIVTEFSTLACSIITTTRKLFTVLLSVVLFGNALTERQWLGTTCVFAGLFLDAYYGKSGKSL